MLIDLNALKSVINSLKQLFGTKVTSITNNNTDNEYPSAKAVKTYVDNSIREADYVVAFTDDLQNPGRLISDKELIDVTIAYDQGKNIRAIATIGGYSYHLVASQALSGTSITYQGTGFFEGQLVLLSIGQFEEFAAYEVWAINASPVTL